MEYVIGNTYWASNPKAGKHMQGCGELIGWKNRTTAMLFNKRWGIIFATKENLDKHNKEN